ncbi:MAG: CotH kinase family protein, partial [Flavobacteriaceae bacterium]
IYQLSNQMGQYATKTAFYELEINGAFKGTYVLMEKIKRDKNRVNISKNKAEDISGGYILKIDKPTGDGEWYDETIAFGSQYSTRGELESFRNISFLYEYPKSDDITTEQKEYIQNYIYDFETALVSEEFTSAENGYRKYIDIDSFIDFFILNEISKNPDGFRLSTYMHKDKGKKLKMGPIWDFNIAFGNVDYCNGEATSGWAYQFNSICPGDTWQVPFWWGRLLEDPDFIITLQTRWNNLRNSTLATQSLMNDIEGFQEILKSSSASDKNFAKWLILGKYVWPNAFVGDSYVSEINYLKDWITNRMEWLDNNINNL